MNCPGRRVGGVRRQPVGGAPLSGKLPLPGSLHRPVREDSAVGRRDEDEELLRQIYVAKAEGDIEALTAALRDPVFRDTAATALGDLGAREAAGDLVPLLDARDPHARAAAATALGKLDAGDAGSRILELAQHDPVDWVQAWALWAIWKLGLPETPGLALRSLEAGSWTVRRTAVVILGELGDPTALEPIQRARQREPLLGRLLGRERPYREAMRALRTNVAG